MSLVLSLVAGVVFWVGVGGAAFFALAARDAWRVGS